MLRITVELLPGGDATRAREIARMRIANISNLADVSDYAVDSSEAPNPVAGTPACDRRATVYGHSRRQTVWTLIAKAAAATAG
jgi:hypothetical protein